MHFIHLFSPLEIPTDMDTLSAPPFDILYVVKVYNDQVAPLKKRFIDKYEQQKKRALLVGDEETFARLKALPENLSVYDSGRTLDDPFEF